MSAVFLTCVTNERNVQTDFESGKQFGRFAVSVDVDGVVAAGACPVISAVNGKRPREDFECIQVCGVLR
jgi:hypothetical protein